ncbi:MAG: stage V sporulation protein SpoVM [Clostridiales bacterium]|nr:stage V sporulation protein SpoVM [Clostridiales bacterium]
MKIVIIRSPKVLSGLLRRLFHMKNVRKEAG